jgi:hypothetical protein
VLLLVVARKRKTDLKRVHPCWFVVLSRKQKNISGHTAVLLLLVATKQKMKQVHGCLFGVLSRKEKPKRSHRCVVFLLLGELNIAVTPLCVCYFIWKTTNKRFQAVTPLLVCYLV